MKKTLRKIRLSKFTNESSKWREDVMNKLRSTRETRRVNHSGDLKEKNQFSNCDLNLT